MDWGRTPGSYGWLFPKGDRLTVGVIAAKGGPDEQRAYLESYVDRLGLTGARVLHESGHLTRCRTADSPLGGAHLLLAGDAAGLLDPWMREGISFAVRSGAAAGRLAASGARSVDATGVQLAYERWVAGTLAREMDAGRAFLSAFERRPALLHTVLTRTPLGWAAFRRMCLGTTTLPALLARRVARLAIGAAGGT